MLTIIPELPKHVFAVRAVGEVTADDLKTVLLPGLNRVVEEFDAIHYLLVLDTAVGNFTSGAWLQDMKVGIRHFTKWKKIAVVTEQQGVEKFTDLFSALVPGEAKGFTHAQLEEAKQWVAEK
ncbi:MAG: STAS/SEC14 domain-containing protein [Chitinophagaceae bacterium]|nr:MAG: STAS/SEC14 domain-containing protein [Chitinophagaceae bacterium]